MSDVTRKQRLRNKLPASNIKALAAVGMAVSAVSGALWYTLRRKPDRALGAIEKIGKIVNFPLVNPDRQLAAKVRSAIDETLGESHDINVEAESGRIILRGTIIKSDLKRLLTATYLIDGVRDISDRLEIHENPEDAAQVH